MAFALAQGRPCPCLSWAPSAWHSRFNHSRQRIRTTFAKKERCSDRKEWGCRFLLAGHYQETLRLSESMNSRSTASLLGVGAIHELRNETISTIYSAGTTVLFFLVMAARALFRPLAFNYVPSSLPRLVRSYSENASKSYGNILVESPRPGVGLGMFARLYFTVLDIPELR